jgi:hypothetical protein
VIELEHHDDVWLVQMHSGENRFNRQMVTELNGALDTVEAVNGPAALARPFHSQRHRLLTCGVGC